MKEKEAGIKPDFDKRGGLIVAIVQDAETKQVLMQAYLNEEAWNMTIQTGEAVFWSTSRNEIWHKGATSGNTMKIKDLVLDCDCDCALMLVEMKKDSVACHNGTVSCFTNGIKL